MACTPSDARLWLRRSAVHCSLFAPFKTNGVDLVAATMWQPPVLRRGFLWPYRAINDLVGGRCCVGDGVGSPDFAHGLLRSFLRTGMHHGQRLAGLYRLAQFHQI